MKNMLIWFVYLVVLTFAFISCDLANSNNAKTDNSNNDAGNHKSYPPIKPPAYQLPPDPGSAGKKTLKGIDSNNNGIRDDLEIAIYNYAPKPEEERLRAALIQNAKAKQLAIIAGHTESPQMAIEAYEAISRSILCQNIEMKRSGVTNETYMGWGTYITKKAVNTSERIEAYMRFNEALSGKVLEGEKNGNPIPCDYDREKEAQNQSTFSAQAFNVQSAYNLPPDPGEAGKATLEGIDSDNDGIRDDVQIAIYKYAPRPDQEEWRQMMFQMAKTFLLIIKLDLSDTEIMLATHKDYRRAHECYKLRSMRSDYQDLDLIISAVRNTPERRKATNNFYRTTESNGLNPFTSSADPVPCDYDKQKQ
jgi:hypothetical protein